VSPAAKAWQADIVRLLRDQLATLNNFGFVLVNDAACILDKLSMPAPDLAAVRLGGGTKRSRTKAGRGLTGSGCQSSFT
jgi:hypothetical protein